MLPSLQDFLTSHPQNGNAWVDEPGFESMYVRVGPKYLNGVFYPRVLDIASVEVIQKGKGVFTAFIHSLHNQGHFLYAENVLNDRLENKLRRMGFTQQRNVGPPFCFYLLPTDTLLKG